MQQPAWWLLAGEILQDIPDSETSVNFFTASSKGVLWSLGKNDDGKQHKLYSTSDTLIYLLGVKLTTIKPQEARRFFPPALIWTSSPVTNSKWYFGLSQIWWHCSLHALLLILPSLPSFSVALVIKNTSIVRVNTYARIYIYTSYKTHSLYWQIQKEKQWKRSTGSELYYCTQLSEKKYIPWGI